VISGSVDEIEDMRQDSIRNVVSAENLVHVMRSGDIR
jgi:hypothetical protein